VAVIRAESFKPSKEAINFLRVKQKSKILCPAGNSSGVFVFK
jgi:hypothetical protein